MTDNRNSGSVVVQSYGLPTLLTVAFVVLKLLGVITWSWWWVVSPLWISFGLGVLCLAVFLLIAAVLALSSKR